MNSSPTLIADAPHLRAPSKPKPARLFYSAASALILLLMFWGFQQYYIHGQAFPGRPIAPPIHTLVRLHAIAMTSWVLLFLIQPLLIATRSHRIHMTLGRIGALLAASILILGLMLAVQSTRLIPPQARIWGLPPRQFMIVPFGTALIFALFVAIAVYYRRRPHIHRPMMLMATLIVIAAAVARIAPLNHLYENTIIQTIFGPFFWTFAFATLLLAINSLLARSFDRWFAIAYVSLTACYLLTWHLATTSAWDRVATLLL